MGAKSSSLVPGAWESLPALAFFTVADLVFAGLLFSNAFFGMQYSFLLGLTLYPLAEMALAAMGLVSGGAWLLLSRAKEFSGTGPFSTRLVWALAEYAVFGLVAIAAMLCMALFAIAIVLGLAGGAIVIVVVCGRLLKLGGVLYGRVEESEKAPGLWHRLFDEFGLSIAFGLMLFVIFSGTYGETTTKAALLLPSVLFLVVVGLIAVCSILLGFGARWAIAFVVSLVALALLFLPGGQTYPNQYALSVIAGSWYAASGLSTIARLIMRDVD